MKPLLLVIGLVTITAAIFAAAPINTPALPSPPLKELAQRHDLALGNHAIANRINEPRYRDILTTQFSLAILDNTPNWYFTDGGLRPSEHTYDFAQMDELVTFAQKHDMPIQAHHYVWGEEKWLPPWLKEGAYAEGQLKEILKRHILAVGERYQGKIQEWTVVNEAFTRNRHIYGLRDWWTDNIGNTDYIDDAFRWARQADPTAKLILNDFHNEGINTISNDMYDYIAAAKARGVPIDGLGMQMHIDGTHPPTKDEVIANMQRFGKLGVAVYVTEFDVNMNDLPISNAEKDEIAGRIYYEMLRACIESDACNSFAYLGITDKETWYNYVGLEGARPLMFDRNYRPKPAFYETRRALEEK